MKKVYLISGLGADHRAFDRLKLDFESEYIPWIRPLSMKESLEEYCTRLNELIDPDCEPIIIGLSLGGLMTNQISRLRPIKKAILISTLTNRDERPPMLQFFKRAPIYKSISAAFIKQSFTAPTMFIKKTPAAKRLINGFEEMLRDTDDLTFKWGIKQAVAWNLDKPKADYIHIHGNNDKLFPMDKMVPPDYIIDGGDHFMIATRAGIISEILNKEIAI